MADIIDVQTDGGLGTLKLAPPDVDVVPYVHRLVLGVICVLLTPIGLFGNGLVVVSVMVSKKLRTPTNILVVNLAVADLLACVVSPFLFLQAFIKSSDEFLLPEIICQLATGVSFVITTVSISTLTAIALVRWYVITRSIRGHRGLHTPRRVAILVVIIWTMSTAYPIPGFLLGTGGVGYDSYYLACMVIDPSLIVVIVQVGFIGTNLILTAILYSLIMRFVLRHNSQFRKKYQVPSLKVRRASENRHPTCGNTKEVINRREIEITKNLFLVVCIFVFSWLPNCINFSIPGQRAFHLYCRLISYGNCLVNPIIYGLRHPNFREVFRKLLCRSSAQSKSVDVNIWLCSIIHVILLPIMR